LVPGHTGIEGNETAFQLTNKGPISNPIDFLVATVPITILKERMDHTKEKKHLRPYFKLHAPDAF
jgi:hypothetical protein